MVAISITVNSLKTPEFIRDFGVNSGVTPEIYRHFSFCIN